MCLLSVFFLFMLSFYWLRWIVGGFGNENSVIVVIVGVDDLVRVGMFEDFVSNCYF